MDENIAHFETLKQILRHARQPDRLNDHPWTKSLIVQDALEACPQLAQASPGQQLIAALAGLFPQLQPATPPRAGKRIDPRWGEFGLLAALYFTPFNHGTSFPTSLLDAWGRIDLAILHSVYGGSMEKLSEEQIKTYRLVGDEVAFGSASTLSDWHKKGLQRFTEITLNRERYLARTHAKPSSILEGEGTGTMSTSTTHRTPTIRNRRPWSTRKRIFWFSFGLLLIAAIFLGALKAWKIYDRGMLVYGDIACLQQAMKEQTDVKSLDARCSALLSQPPSSNAASKEVELFERVVPVLTASRTDLAAFKEEARPVLWLSPKLEWIPVYGSEIASAPATIELAEHALDASLLAAQAVDPLLHELGSAESQLDPAALTALLVQAGPEFDKARQELDQALEIRKTIPAEQFSPRLKGLILDELDPKLVLAKDGLSLVQSLPGLLGAGSDGPKTYLLLVQNEDELRPTGGFITATGNLVVCDGKVMRFDFESVDNDVLEDWSQPYPAAPWQLEQYMNSRVLILRDANWFSDFPTTTKWVEYLYAYSHSHSVDGVIAFDQQFLVILLRQLGPLDIDGVPYPISAENVIEYMRNAKQPPPGELMPGDWTRKAFMKKLADAVLDKLTHGNHDWPALTQAALQALAERHLLLQFDDPVVSSLIAERGWDDALRPAGGDYLMVTDTNIGFNKTNAVVDVSLTYDVDLMDPGTPGATLTLTHRNNAADNVPCVHWNTGQITGEEQYPIDRCYWSYLRVYKQADIELLAATPHAIPGDWMLLHKDVPARVDELEEEVPGVQGFGTLLVVPGGTSLSTSFQFGLPETVLSEGSTPNQYSYHLKVQKQPGTLEHPLTIRIHVPKHAVLDLVPADAIVQNNDILLKTDLRTDVEIEVVFTMR